MADNFGYSAVPSAPVELDTSDSALLLQEQEDQNVDPGPPPPFVASPPPQVPGAPPAEFLSSPQQPIKTPPPGKKYVRCPCNALLTCNISAVRVICPRPNCQRVINLAPTPSVPPTVTVPSMNRGMPSQLRYTCGHCHEIFVFRSRSCLARCPHCRRTSSVGDYAKNRAIIFAIIGFVFLAAGIGVTVGTLEIAKKSGGIYVVWIGAFIAGILNLIRSGFYCAMTVSPVEEEP